MMLQFLFITISPKTEGILDKIIFDTYFWTLLNQYFRKKISFYLIFQLKIPDENSKCDHSDLQNVFTFKYLSSQ